MSQERVRSFTHRVRNKFRNKPREDTGTEIGIETGSENRDTIGARKTKKNWLEQSLLS